ncbi:SCO2523 family variant P-loop protein [Luedemannella flava]|uniref:SCO2523 family variant P-loop protein n=1 Tax=Luedemannella flava TaxID=349316 RepID=A0ABN2MI71_9ACTN
MILVFAISDKGGTGRSVTSANILYRSSLAGRNVCYLDFDFGSPTAGTILHVDEVGRGTNTRTGLHSYLLGRTDQPHEVDVWSETDRSELRNWPPNAGRLVLLPGDRNGGEFAANSDVVERCVRLFNRLKEDYDVCLVDLSAGRSYAAQIALAATAHEKLLPGMTARWLVFHRWTRQHIVAASALWQGAHGIVDTGRRLGHNDHVLANMVRFVRTAVVNPNSEQVNVLRAAQVAFLLRADEVLRGLAHREGVGTTNVLGQVPLEPLLQWREQLITDSDVEREIANPETVEAFHDLSVNVIDDAMWEGL